MCTVVVRWSASACPVVLALRDELTCRPFDDPGAWWADQPDVVGGRDRLAGGSWCVTDVRTATTALVLNRPLRREAAPGASSRGVLPLLAVRHGQDWPRHVDGTGMATFTVVLVSAVAVGVWDFDGDALALRMLGEGTHMLTSGGAEDGKAGGYLPAFTASAPEDWEALVRREEPHDDPAALVVRHAVQDKVFATVFGQLILAVPGRMDLASSRRPWAEA